MLTLLLGRAGSGKTTAVLTKMKQEGTRRRQILLVPEQASHEMERLFCQMGGNTAGQYGEVLSFTRLEHRVLSQSGGLAESVLDDGGRVLVMYAALQAVLGNLTVYAMPSRKPEFLTSLLSTVDELKSCCITPAQLEEIASDTEGLSGQKLQDLALIYGAYDMMTSRGRLDPRDRLTRLADRLREGDFSRGKDFYLDGFTDFTPQESLVIQELLRKGHSLTVTLTCDHLQEDEHGMGVFSPARHTGNALLRLAKKAGTSIGIEVLPVRENSRSPALAYLEQTLFSQTTKSYDGEDQEAIQLYAADDRRGEGEWTAAKILELVRETGLRYREIAVCARDLAPYQDLLESIFADNGIPLFQSIMSDILEKPIFTLITGALSAVIGNYSYEDLFRYLKTGLTSLTQEDCDLLENYAITWNLRGSQWTSEKEWTMHPDGFGRRMTPEDIALLVHLNQIRRQVVAPLEKLRKHSGNTIKDQVISLYSFLEEMDVPNQLSQRAESFITCGEPELAEEDGQLWEIFCNGLDQCVELLGDLSVDLETFARLLKLLLSQYTVGSIPASLDRVTAGDAPRLSNRRVEALFFLGTEEGAIPQIAPSKGLLTDQDRELLSSYGLETAPLVEEKTYREMTILYVTCTRPSRFLYLTWPSMGEKGTEKRPSFLTERIRLLFPCAQRSNGLPLPTPALARALSLQDPDFCHALAQIPEYAQLFSQLDQAQQWERGKLSRESVQTLYGDRVAMSASRMDRYKSCHFAYYLQYGLRAKSRRRAGFQAPEYGTFVHSVLESVLRGVKEGGGVEQVGEKEIRALTRQAIRRYVTEELGDLTHQTPRFRYLFRRLERSVILVVDNVIEELRVSQFQPIFFELGFGRDEQLPPVEMTENGVTLSISGFVDRVDGWEHNGRLYLRVVDYKTGRKSFDFTEVWNGMGLQMLLYLFTLEDKGAAILKEEIIPAGVLYLPAREAVISGVRGMSEPVRRKLIDRELVRRGLILEEPAVVEAMEEPREEGIRFLPVRVSAKTGKITGDCLVSAQRLGRLKKHTDQILREICQEVAAGNIQADPYWRGAGKNACLYCEYAAACHFEEGRGGDRRRWLPTVRNGDFWKSLEREEEGGSGLGLSEDA